MIKADKFRLLHVSLLRQYLAIDFLGDFYLEDPVKSGPLVERVIDDFVLFCFLVGNDFLPHLPFSEIGDGGLNKLFACYKSLMHSRGNEGYFLSSMDGKIDYGNLFIFLQSYLAVENSLVEEMLANEKWKIGETRICTSETPQDLTPPSSVIYPEETGSDEELSAPTDWKTAVPIIKKKTRRGSRGTPESVPAAMAEY